jgi:hypothetical protein
MSSSIHNSILRSTDRRGRPLAVIAWFRPRSRSCGLPSAAPPPGPRDHALSRPAPRTRAGAPSLKMMASTVVAVSTLFLVFGAAASVADTQPPARWSQGPVRWCYPGNTWWRCQQRSVTQTVYAPPSPAQSVDEPVGDLSLTAEVRWIGNRLPIGPYAYPLTSTNHGNGVIPQCHTYIPTGDPTAELALQSGLSASTFDCGAFNPSNEGFFWHWATLSGARRYVLEDWYQIQLTRTDTTPYGQSATTGWTGTYCLRIASDATGRWWYGVFPTHCYDALVKNA